MAVARREGVRLLWLLSGPLVPGFAESMKLQTGPVGGSARTYVQVYIEVLPMAVNRGSGFLVVFKTKAGALDLCYR